MRLRVLAPATLTMGLLVLAAPPAFAAVETRVEFNNATFFRGATTLSTFVNCTDSETGSDVQTDATLTVTLTQGQRSRDRTVKDFTCFGDDLVNFTFRDFHPGTAFFEGQLTACNCTTRRTATRPAARPSLQSSEASSRANE
jgi:hypothetical protein